MRRTILCAVLCVAACARGHAQSAADLPSAQTAARPGETEEQHGRRLLDQMLTALGGDKWLHKGTRVAEGQVASFFRNEPTGSVVRFVEYRQYATGTAPELTRVEYLHGRGMITPGTKRDVIHLWTADAGLETTYKGTTPLPADQVADYMRRRAHTIEAVMSTWIKQPGVVIVANGSGMRDRRPVDKVSILTRNNDAVELELDQTTHLPLQRAFEWRNQQFRDHDIDEEVYGDWRVFDGVSVPMNTTRYKNGDMAGQSFLFKVHFGAPIASDMFDPERLNVHK